MNDITKMIAAISGGNNAVNPSGNNEGKGAHDAPLSTSSPKQAQAARTARIRALNDQLRHHFIGGQVVVTSSIGHLSDDDRLALFEAVRTFDDFTEDNDPYGEHDFGSFQFKGDTYFWKIDCYDLDRLGHSPDATDPSVTRRVMTIFRAEEY